MRYATVMFALFLLAVSAYAGTYVENFDDGDFDGWGIFDGGEPGAEWTIEDGVLTGRREILWISDLLFGEEDWRNYTIECDARMVEPLGEELCLMGFDLRVVGTEIVDGQLDNDDVSPVMGYLAQQAWFSAWIDNEFSGESEYKDIDFELGRWYRLKAVVHEDTFEFYVDGRLVVSYTDDRFPTGRLGVFVAACEAEFDNVIITGDDVPDNTDSMTAEEILAIMKAMDDAYRIPDADLVVSHYAEDAIIYCPPFEPYGKEGDREFLKWLFETYPNFSLANAHYLASGTEKVGIAEHSSTWIFPDTGTPYDGYHICAHDFDAGKMTRLNCYIDYAAEQIQSGAMPPRNLGDMIPSFSLPDPEGTGLAPMEASAEIIARLNSHDLSSVAKMIRHDVDVWFSFIGRTTSRPEFIDIHEQMLGGFSNMSWESTRRVNMGNGWVFSEVKLIGTNDGEFLGKSATGLPMEVRAGLIEHYDEDGLADYVHFHFDTLSVPGQGAPAEPVEDFSNIFFMELTPRLNMISLPLKPQTPYTARSLAEEIGATVVIKYDEAMGRFVGFDLNAPGDGFPIEGGKGYIVNVPGGGTVTFVGAAWTNEPDVEAAPPIAQTSSAWAFMVSGFVADADNMSIRDGNYTVTVKNLRTGNMVTETVGAGGYFSAAWADLSRNAVIRVGDRVEVTLTDAYGGIASGPFVHEVTPDAIRNALASIPLRLGHIIPRSSSLLQNYPNPFNPETWIPFHLAQEADVSVRIYDASGKLVRALSLGYREAGIYVDRSKAVYWDGKNDAGEEVASGVYFYSINAGDFSATRKMIVKR